MKRDDLKQVEILVVVLLPVLFLLMFQTSYEIITLIYMVIVTLLATKDINYDHKDYGQVIYKNKRHLICKNNCLIYIWMIQMILYVLAVRLNPYVLTFALVQSMVLIVIIKQQLSMIFFTKGLFYKGRFYRWDDIKEAYHVKNYKEVYEIHMGYSRIIRLTSDELALTKEVG